ncbi:MAG TPA: MFS transporter, partial [Flavisolibacter sp.]|nr:MFS transporter [Flavisolibacter sp.]
MQRLPTLSQSSWLRYSTFFYLYFMQGVPSGFALTALVNYLTAKGTSPEVLGSFMSIIGIPWIIQLVWGPLIDRYRYSVVGHYKHWILLTQLAAFAASLLLLIVDSPENQVWLLAGLFFTHSLFASVQDASVDALAILATPPAEQGRVNAFMRGGILLGISAGAAGLSIVLHHWGFRAAVLLQSGLLLFFTLLFFVTKLYSTDPLIPRLGGGVDPQTGNGQSRKLSAVFKQLGRALFTGPNLRIFAVIGTCYFCFSVFRRSINYYVIRSLNWSDQDLSVLSGSWGALVTLSVMALSGFFADKWGPTRLQRIVLTALALFILVFSASLLFTSSRVVVTSGLLAWGVADPLYSIAAFPILMLLCNKEIAGSQFTAYMALINLAEIGGGYISGWLLLWIPGSTLGIGAGAVLLLLA